MYVDIRCAAVGSRFEALVLDCTTCYGEGANRKRRAASSSSLHLDSSKKPVKEEPEPSLEQMIQDCSFALVMNSNIC